MNQTNMGCNHRIRVVKCTKPNMRQAAASAKLVAHANAGCQLAISSLGPKPAIVRRNAAIEPVEPPQLQCVNAFETFSKPGTFGQQACLQPCLSHRHGQHSNAVLYKLSFEIHKEGVQPQSPCCQPRKRCCQVSNCEAQCSHGTCAMRAVREHSGSKPAPCPPLCPSRCGKQAQSIRKLADAEFPALAL